LKAFGDAFASAAAMQGGRARERLIAINNRLSGPDTLL
jgi:hypothetical protein